MRLVADEPFVIALAQGNAPERRFHHACVKGIGQDVMHLLRPHFALGVAWKLRDGLEVAFDFGLRCQLAAGETLHGILNDRCMRLIAHDDVAPVPRLLELVADGNEERVIAALDSGLHLLNRLALVLHPLQFALRGDDGFDEFAFRRVLELEIEAFGLRCELCQLGAKADVKLGIPREALEIIKDDDVILSRVLFQVLKQRHHAGTLHEISRRAFYVAEDLLDDISACGSVLAAAMLLRAAPVTVLVLPDAGDARVQQRLDFSLYFRLPFHIHRSLS